MQEWWRWQDGAEDKEDRMQAPTYKRVTVAEARLLTGAGTHLHYRPDGVVGREPDKDEVIVVRLPQEKADGK